MGPLLKKIRDCQLCKVHLPLKPKPILNFSKNAKIMIVGQAPDLTDTVKNWKAFAPEQFPLPHPSPRNNIWLAKNPWFEKSLVPRLKQVVQVALS